jgi:mRNA interferase MazF
LTSIERGELWWADLGLPRGSAPALRRPVLIISADQYNRSELRTVVVVVLTSNDRLAALPGNVAVSSDLVGPVSSDLVGLEADSVVNVTQVATIDRGSLEQRIGVLPDWLIAQVDAGLERALALGRRP